MSAPFPPEKPTGLRRWALAFGNSWSGFLGAYRSEAAVRQEVATIVVAVPLACWLPLSPIERVMLIGSVLLVLLVELINTAVEAAIDRISLDRHPLSGQAKDLGSAAVLLSVGIAALCWGVLAGPVVLRMLR